MKYPNHIILDVNKFYANDYEKKDMKNLSANSLFLTRNPNISENFSINYKFHNSSYPKTNKNSYLNSLSNSLFDIQFIRKEKLYTKLKYSRCPQYDIVSGGFAALIAGFIGFLISEKFGIELVDSGDFYNALMYGVFISFFIRVVLYAYSNSSKSSNPASLRINYIFLMDLTKMILKYIKLTLMKLLK